MAEQYLLHFPDGTEYGPIDRATLREWHDEGRIPTGALIWPDGAPEWLPIEDVLAALPLPAAVSATSPESAVVEVATVDESEGALADLIEDDGPDTLPPTPSPPLPALSRGSGLSSRTRTLVLLAGGAFLVVVLLAGLVAVLRPTLARRRAVAAVERHALADRRVGDAGLGFVVDLPAGWVALADDNPYVVTRGARLRVAFPTLDAFGAVQAESHPQMMGDLDRHLDAVLQARRPSQPSLRELDRGDARLGRGQGRLVRTAWEDGLHSLQGATVAWVDGYEYYWLHAWAPTSAGAEFTVAFDALMRAISPSGALGTRVDEAEERFVRRGAGTFSEGHPSPHRRAHEPG